jgi:peptidase M48-like protein
MAKGFWQAISVGMSVSLATIAPVVVTAGGHADGARKSPTGMALAFFEAEDAVDGGVFLTRIRPAPVSPALRVHIIASLPTEGELRPSATDLRKLASIDPILRLHERHDTIVIKLIDVKHAFVGLHARTVLLISRDALDMMRPEELQALTAHEIGHDYFWDEYARAMADHDDRRMQELELRCDGIAVLTLRQLGLDPENLTRAATGLTRYNERLGAVGSANSYVSLSDRVKFIRTIARK